MQLLPSFSTAYAAYLPQEGTAVIVPVVVAVVVSVEDSDGVEVTVDVAVFFPIGRVVDVVVVERELVVVVAVAAVVVVMDVVVAEVVTAEVTVGCVVGVVDVEWVVELVMVLATVEL